MELDDERRGRVRFRRWDHLHREKLNRPFWLGHQPPPGQEPGDLCLTVLWYGYPYRWPVEAGIRFRKQYLYWTLPRFQTPERCDRWTMLVTMAQWQLFLAREVVQGERLPWQAAQENLTPERVLQSLGGLFRQIDMPAPPPQRCGKSPGWPMGRPRTLKKRHRVVKETKNTS